ncbi:hypothetical protein [Reichenbachiella sp.]|uniref:hypothetical protein n=1 Tax=Reichenbachiella sp. TaxID=2184521 RepID=UPI003BAF58D3
MGIGQKIICVNLVANQVANEHLTQVVEVLKNHKCSYDILFYTTNEKELKAVLQQRSIDMLYVIAHAEQDVGIVYKDNIFSPKGLISLLGGRVPKRLYLNCCFGYELGYQEHLLRLGCEEMITNQGFIKYNEAFANGLKFVKRLAQNTN